MDWGQWLVIGFSVFLLTWYIIGAVNNRRRGQVFFTWLQDGILSKPDSVHWNGVLRSAAHLRWDKPMEKFRKLEMLFALRSRENLPLWLYQRIQGQGDELHMRADLRTAPAQDVEIGRKGDRTYEAYLAGQLNEPYATMLIGNFEIAWHGKRDQKNIERLMVFLTRYEGAMLRLSLRRKSPHLLLRTRMPSAKNGTVDQFLETLLTVLD